MGPIQPAPVEPRGGMIAAAAVIGKHLVTGVPKRKIKVMTKPMTSLLADALRLDDDARAELAAELLASLDGPADPDAEQAWNVEIERRITAIEAGSIPLEPWDQVKRRIERDILGR